jgi:hypothetical protein
MRPGSAWTQPPKRLNWGFSARAIEGPGSTQHASSPGKVGPEVPNVDWANDRGLMLSTGGPFDEASPPEHPRDRS